MKFTSPYSTHHPFISSSSIPWAAIAVVYTILTTITAILADKQMPCPSEWPADVTDCPEGHQELHFPSYNGSYPIIRDAGDYWATPSDSSANYLGGETEEHQDSMSTVVTRRSTTYPYSSKLVPYDPMLGWYTAATLSAFLLAFLACVGLERVKQEAVDAWDRR